MKPQITAASERLRLQMGVKYNPRDPYFLQAKKDGFRSRAAYKLQQIQEKYRVLKPGDHVLDLGAAPGGFLQVAAGIVGSSGVLIGVDLAAIEPLPQNNIQLLKADVLAEEFESRIAEVHPDRFDVIISDMAPKTTGIASVDKTRSIVLAEQVMEISLKLLKSGGNQVIKVLEGPDFHPFLKNVKSQFSKVNGFKPPASRKGSSEIFIVARGLRNNPK